MEPEETLLTQTKRNKFNEVRFCVFFFIITGRHNVPNISLQKAWQTLKIHLYVVRVIEMEKFKTYLYPQSRWNVNNVPVFLWAVNISMGASHLRIPLTQKNKCIELQENHTKSVQLQTSKIIRSIWKLCLYVRTFK